MLLNLFGFLLLNVFFIAEVSQPEPRRRERKFLVLSYTSVWLLPQVVLRLLKRKPQTPNGVTYAHPSHQIRV